METEEGAGSAVGVLADLVSERKCQVLFTDRIVRSDASRMDTRVVISI